MTAANHTPLPWDIDPMGYIRGANGENILEHGDNAAFIVRVVNSHNDLLKALEAAASALAECYELQSYPADGSTEQDHALNKALETIARATGQQ